MIECCEGTIDFLEISRNTFWRNHFFLEIPVFRAGVIERGYEEGLSCRRCLFEENEKKPGDLIFMTAIKSF